MLRARLSSESKRNDGLKTQRQTRDESNLSWLKRAEAALSKSAPKLLLLGGRSVADFRVRVAQSHARNDMKPSFWSHAGLVVPGRGKGPATLWHAPLELGSDISLVPETNGVKQDKLTFCANKKRFPNLALIEFPGASVASITKAAKHYQRARLSLDLVTPLVEWLGFIWGAGSRGNPLLSGVPLPSASFVEAAFANSDIDLAPGLSERVHCPEAIWQAAVWWTGFYEKEHEGAGAPKGRYTLGQQAAAVSDG